MPSFDTQLPSCISAWSDADLASLPNAEDDRFEFKSSNTVDAELGNKISRAASAFWNSGGGVLVVGVGGDGRPDGGLSDHVGRQRRRDWADQAVARTEPAGPFAIASVTDSGAGLSIGPDKVVLVVGFGQSYAGPHMAFDGRYYVRAGAHTLPASHFLVEAIRARRGVGSPVLRPLLRVKAHQEAVVEMVIVAVNDAPALDAEISIEPLPTVFKEVGGVPFPIKTALIDRQHPLAFDVGVYGGPATLRDAVDVRLRYRDILGRSYDDTHHLVPFEAIPILKIGKPATERLVDVIEKLTKAIDPR